MQAFLKTEGLKNKISKCFENEFKNEFEVFVKRKFLSSKKTFHDATKHSSW